MIAVAHVMRTYGVHGGERQLGQLFSLNPGDRFRDIFLFVYRDDRCQRFFEKIPGLDLEFLLPLKARLFPSLVVEIVVLLAVLPILQLRTIWMLRKRNVRICVAHGLQGAMTCWLAACLLSRVRFVYVHRGTKSKGGSGWLFRLLYYPYDAVAGVSEASARSLDPMLVGRTAIALPNGIDWKTLDSQAIECTPLAKSALRIISVGRLMPGKGQTLIVDAFALAIRRVERNVELLFAGDGPDDNRLREQVAALNLSGSVHFLGYTSRVVCEMTNADIFVHASETEGLSNAVLEAMALGRPSVVVDAPGVTECHVDGTTGYVVERQAEALAVRFVELINGADLRDAMGEAARRHVREKYSITANLAHYHELYSQMLADT